VTLVVEPTREELMAILRWAYQVSETALQTMYTKKDRDARDRALSQINYKLKELVR
jgi:hypothetical protein